MRLALIFSGILSLFSTVPTNAQAMPRDVLREVEALETLAATTNRPSDACELARSNAAGAVALCETQRDILSCVDCVNWCKKLSECLRENGMFFEWITHRCAIRCERAFLSGIRTDD